MLKIKPIRTPWSYGEIINAIHLYERKNNAWLKIKSWIFDFVSFALWLDEGERKEMRDTGEGKKKNKERKGAIFSLDLSDLWLVRMEEREKSRKSLWRTQHLSLFPPKFGGNKMVNYEGKQLMFSFLPSKFPSTKQQNIYLPFPHFLSFFLRQTK